MEQIYGRPLRKVFFNFGFNGLGCVNVVVKAADEFRDKTIRPNQMWQTDFTYLKANG